jgi:preprotein translocase SecE subunit
VGSLAKAAEVGYKPTEFVTDLIGLVGSNMGENETNTELSLGFIEGCREELRKVSSPTRQEATQATIVTLVMVSCALALFDLTFRQLMIAILS